MTLLDDLCVPNLFAATGSSAWGNPDYPWLIGSTLVPYSLEAVAFADYLKENQPDAKVAMLRQADEFGDDLRGGLRGRHRGHRHRAGRQVEEYPAGSDEVATQVTSLAASGADAFFNGGTLLACPNALDRSPERGLGGHHVGLGHLRLQDPDGYRPARPVTACSASPTSRTRSTPRTQANPALVEMQEAVAEYQPSWKGRELDPENAIIGYGWTQAELFVQALEAAEAPSRLAVMEAISNLDGVTSSLHARQGSR